MNEALWLPCEDPRKLLVWLRGVASDRKLRLFVCDFWRSWWQAQPDSQPDLDVIELVEYAEKWAEVGMRPAGSLTCGFGFKWHPLVARNATDAANWTIRQTTGSKSRLDCLRRDPRNELFAAAEQIRLLREIFGNPFCPISLDERWLTSTVVGLARTIYEDQVFERMPILGDALLDAGCDNQDVLGHCRSQGPHVRGCWLVDSLLQNE